FSLGLALLAGSLLACSSSGSGGGNGRGGSGGTGHTTGAAGGNSERATGGNPVGGSAAGGNPVGGSATGGGSRSTTNGGGTSGGATGERSSLGGATGGGVATGGLEPDGGSSVGGTLASGGSAAGGSTASGGSATEGGGASGGTSGSTSTVKDGGAPTDAAMAGKDAGADGGSAGSSGSRSTGCGKSTTRPDPGTQQTIPVSGSSRTYQIYVPTGYSPETALTLIFAFHGGGGSAAGARTDFKLEAVVGNNAIIVYPNDATNYGSGSDIPFFDAMLADTNSKYCIDTHRVFATGFSMGGIFVNGIGCLRGGTTVRGIIPVAGSGPNPNMGPASEADIACPSGTPTADVAVMIIHGTADTNALFKYAQWEANYWTKAEGCTSTSTTTNLASPYQGCVAYQGCRVPVDFCQHTGGHMVPSTAAANIWAFITNLQ
ncbi:MAG TPA: hypothetical protein VF518_02660, partial [Polyangia bacterium]